MSELRQFVAYCATGYGDAEGRWGNKQMTRPVRPRTIHTYRGHLLKLYIRETACKIDTLIS